MLNAYEDELMRPGGEGGDRIARDLANGNERKRCGASARRERNHRTKSHEARRFPGVSGDAVHAPRLSGAVHRVVEQARVMKGAIRLNVTSQGVSTHTCDDCGRPIGDGELLASEDGNFCVICYFGQPITLIQLFSEDSSERWTGSIDPLP